MMKEDYQALTGPKFNTYWVAKRHSLYHQFAIPGSESPLMRFVVSPDLQSSKFHCLVCNTPDLKLCLDKRNSNPSSSGGNRSQSASVSALKPGSLSMIRQHAASATHIKNMQQIRIGAREAYRAAAKVIDVFVA